MLPPRVHRRGVVAALLTVLGVAAWWAGPVLSQGAEPAPEAASEPAAPVPQKAVFSHKAHQESFAKKKGGRSWSCEACHTDGKGDATESRPAQGSHATCDSAGCHAKDFYDPKKAKKSQVCLSCHVEGRYWADMSKLRRYPDKCYDDREFATEFSHKQHLAAGVKLKGEALACNSCHQGNGGKIRGAVPEDGGDDCHIQGDLSNPGHDNCVQCHGAAGDNKLKMTDCDGCHKDAGARAATEAKGWAPRVRHSFSHGYHYSFVYDSGQKAWVQKGEPVQGDDQALAVGEESMQCGTCHVDVAGSETVSDAIELVGRGQGRGQSHAICGSCHGKAKVVKLNGRKGGIFTTSDAGTACSRCHTRSFVKSNFKVNLKGVFAP